MIAISRSAALLKTPRRLRYSVTSAKKRLTKLGQEPEVGLCRWKRGCAASQHRISPVCVLEDQVQVETGCCFLSMRLRKAGIRDADGGASIRR
jgi:hypothetical protein